jgi:serine/threonine protein kinase
LVEEPAAAQLFEREVSALMRFQHPGIVRIIETGTLSYLGQRIPYCVMDHVVGRSLEEYIHHRPHLPVSHRVEIITRVSHAVQHVHDHGVVHGDLKPQNILIDLKGQPVVVDFGLARILENQRSRTDSLLGGTLPYLSPEVASGERSLPQSDVYSLGVMLFEILSNAYPISLAGGAREQYRNICLQPPRKLPRKFGWTLRYIVDSTLRKKPKERYLSARELARDLERWSQGERFVRPLSSPTLYRLKLLLRNHWLASSCAAAVVLVLSTLLIRAERLLDRREQVMQAIKYVLRPSNEAGSTLRTTLQENAEKAVQKLENPLDRAELAAIVSEALRGVREWKLALEMAQLAHGLYQQELGSRAYDTLHSGCTLVLLIQRNGRSSEAVEFSNALLPEVERFMGVDHSLTLALVNNLATALRDLGKAQEAITVYQDLVQRTERCGLEAKGTLLRIAFPKPENTCSIFCSSGIASERQELRRPSLLVENSAAFLPK